MQLIYIQVNLIDCLYLQWTSIQLNKSTVLSEISNKEDFLANLYSMNIHSVLVQIIESVRGMRVRERG